MANKPSENADNLKLEPGAWSRFERAVDAAVKSGPKHKPTPEGKEKKARPASNEHVHKGKAKS